MGSLTGAVHLSKKYIKIVLEILSSVVARKRLDQPPVFGSVGHVSSFVVNREAHSRCSKHALTVIGRNLIPNYFEMLFGRGNTSETQRY